jgi:hypothetical protein
MNELPLVLKKVTEEVDMLTSSLATGRAKDYSDYRYICGKIHGLHAAEGFIAAIIENMEKSDD